MKKSAGLLVYRRNQGGGLEVLLAHPGGPLWSRRDDGAWTIPKGEYDREEDPLAAARREFTEETGFTADGPFIDLGEVVQKSGKHVAAWACAGDFDPARMRCNHFDMEWPAHSGRVQSYPEIDRIGWFALEAARRKLNPGQAALLDRLRAAL